MQNITATVTSTVVMVAIPIVVFREYVRKKLVLVTVQLGLGMIGHLLKHLSE